MTAQQMKVLRFKDALRRFEKFKAWQRRLVEEGKSTEEEYIRRCRVRAEQLDL